MELKLTQRFQLQRPEMGFEISPKISPGEMARRVRLAFKQMPEESALIVFAKVMTSDVPHEMKVAVWDAVRYSHIWWHVDEVLNGDVMENPIVQCAFADAVAMRYWRVENQMPSWKDTQAATFSSRGMHYRPPERTTRARIAIDVITHCKDVDAAKVLLVLSKWRKEIEAFEDYNGNNLLWYLTYRDDQNAMGGFSCPALADTLIDFGVDPNHQNQLGLCWNDVARHVNRPEQSFTIQ